MLRNKDFGAAEDFVWSASGTGDYAIRDKSSTIKTFKNFKEHNVFKPKNYTAQQLYGGAFLGVRGTDRETDGLIVFYDWEDGSVVRRIDIALNDVYWADSGELVLLACEDMYYVLQCNRDVIAENDSKDDDEDGIEGSFEPLHEINEKVETGQWVGDCFIYTTGGRLCYYVGGEVITLCHLDRPMYMLGYLPKENRVYLVDKKLDIVSYQVHGAVLEYQTLVVRRDFEAANELLDQIPLDQRNSIARFLESQGFKEEALEVARDYEIKFDLALQLDRPEQGYQILCDADGPQDSMDMQQKWKQLSDVCLARGRIDLFEDCAEKAGDLNGLLLAYTSLGNLAGMEKLSKLAGDADKNNVAFITLLLLGRTEECVQLLIDAGRVSEAAFFSRTYVPSKVSDTVKLWRADLAKVRVVSCVCVCSPLALFSR